MGQGHWIKESDGHYRHYTEEEYAKLEKMASKIMGWIIVLFVVVGIVGLIIQGLVALWNAIF